MEKAREFGVEAMTMWAGFRSDSRQCCSCPEPNCPARSLSVPVWCAEVH